MDFLKRKLPLIIVFFTGMIMIMAFFVPHKPFNYVDEQLSGWYQIISSFSLVLGVVSLMRNHYRKIRSGKQGWGYSGVMFLVFFVTAVAGVMPQWTHATHSFLPVTNKSLFGTESGSIYAWIFDYINIPVASTVFSLLAFYIASAAFRAFRVRKVDATIMLVTALIVMIGRVPFGEMFSDALTQHFPYLSFLGLDKMTSFFLNYPTAAAKRAILLGIALATVSTSLRIILGIERTYMGSDN